MDGSGQLFSPGITGIVRQTVGEARGFEERRKGERYKLELPMQLKNGTGITRDISTSGIFFETESAYSIGDAIRLLLNFEHETLQCEARRLLAGCGWGRVLYFDIWRKQGDANLFLDRMKGIGEGKMYRESFPPG